jgi:hypothetical protein
VIDTETLPDSFRGDSVRGLASSAGCLNQANKSHNKKPTWCGFGGKGDQPMREPSWAGLIEHVILCTMLRALFDKHE